MKKNIGNHIKVHTPNLLQEIMSNKGTEALIIPLNTLRTMLIQVAARAIELNDPKLNTLMLRLTLYEVADPSSPDYNPDLVSEMIEKNS